MPNRLGWTCTLAACLLVVSVDPASAQSGRAKPSIIDYFRDIPSPNVSYQLDGLPVFNQDSVNISQSHRIAQQQVRLALNYLNVYRDQILSGKNQLYNQTFGNFYNTDQNENAFLGLYPQTTQVAVLDYNPISYTESRVYNVSGGLLFTGDMGSSILEVVDLLNDGDPAYGVYENPFRSMRVGDSIFIGDPRNGGEVHRIIGILGVDGGEAIIQLDGTLTQDFVDSLAYRVRRFEERPNPLHYNQVVNTLAAIRDALDRDTIYNGAFNQASYDQVFASGSGTFPGLDDLEAFFDRPIDRAFRQDGFSNSNSPEHLQNIRDRRLGLALLALLWTEDNSSDVGTGITNDEDRPWWGNVATIFGDLNDPNTQNVAQGFLDELVSFVGDFFDPNFIGSADQVPTEYQQWQMIVMSMAEYGNDLSANDIAAINLMMFQDEFFPGGSSLFLENRDAGNYADFAGLFSLDSEMGTFDPFTMEPFGKRAISGFEPIVPGTAFSTNPLSLSFDNGVESLEFNNNVLPDQYRNLR